MRKEHKRIVAAVLAALALVAAFGGGYMTARYQYREAWIAISRSIREGGTPEYIDGEQIIQKPTPAP